TGPSTHGRSTPSTSASRVAHRRSSAAARPPGTRTSSALSSRARNRAPSGTRSCSTRAVRSRRAGMPRISARGSTPPGRQSIPGPPASGSRRWWRSVVGRFRDALAGPGLAGIAEVKRRSPSAGDLRPDADPAALAAAFAGAGAAAVSILVDERFAGSTADLAAARAASDVPLLAKGFFSSEDDLDAVRAAGADAALLILRDLDDRAAARLIAHAARVGLDALV